MQNEQWLAADAQWMGMALRMAGRGRGRCWPNPSVGCVLVQGGQLIAAGRTADGGRPHAETQVLAQAGEAARGATLYVTLEPCAHTGQTPPCVDAVIAAGVARVVVGTHDMDMRTRSQGIAQLRAAGIAVVEAPEPYATQAAQEHAPFFYRLHTGMPYTVLKMATSLDGAIATSSGESQWITGETSRMHAHALRASCDAVLTGIGSVLADNPLLTVRLPGRDVHSPVRVVLDTQLRLPTGARLITEPSHGALWVCCSISAAAEHASKVEALRARGVEVLPCRLNGDMLDLTDVWKRLGEKGINQLLVEAGPGVTTSVLDAQLVQEVVWYRAPLLLGFGARQGARPMRGSHLAAIAAWPCVRRQTLGVDTLEVFRIAPKMHG